MRIAIFMPLVLLGGCASNAPSPSVDWIEVPLTEHTWQPAQSAYRNTLYPVAVAAGTALEFKVNIQEGESIVYELNADINDPDLLDIEFHGHTERVGDAPGTLMFYTVHNEGEESGVLKAPFSGIHGWYLNNRSDQDIVVNISIAGFYEESP